MRDVEITHFGTVKELAYICHTYHGIKAMKMYIEMQFFSVSTNDIKYNIKWNGAF